MMEIVALWLKTVWATAGKWVTAIGVAILAVVSMIVGHRYTVNKAEKRGERSGEEQERVKINTETETKTQEMKEESDETHQESRDLDDDDLTKRMLEQQARRKRRR